MQPRIMDGQLQTLVPIADLASIKKRDILLRKVNLPNLHSTPGFAHSQEWRCVGNSRSETIMVASTDGLAAFMAKV